MIRGDHGRAHSDAGDHRTLHAHRHSRDYVCAVSGGASLCDAPHGGIDVVRVVLVVWAIKGGTGRADAGGVANRQC